MKYSARNKSLLSRANPARSIHTSLYEANKEVPLCTRCGSFTVEAAMVFPIFLFLLLFVLFFLRILCLQVTVQGTLDAVSQEMAVVSAYKHDISLGEAIALCEVKIAKETDGLEYVWLRNAGFNFNGSSVDDNYIALRVTYDIKFPIRVFGDLRWHMTQESMNRKWLGFDPKEWDAYGDYVYMTEYAEVYHRHRSCTYLNPSVVAVSKKEITFRRNKDGSRYQPCHSCHAKRKAQNTVYITDYGDAYHASLSCGGLKRTIYRVPIGQVKNKRACQKCGGL